MPHQCVRCGNLYEDGQIDIIAGCKCGAKMFYYIKPEKFKRLKDDAAKKPVQLKPEEREQIEQEVYDLIGNEIDREKPVILDMETIEVLQPGKYNLDLVKLFKANEPFIIKLEDGKYYVDLIENFSRLRESKTKKHDRR
jgi:uncharacterized protein